MRVKDHLRCGEHCIGAIREICGTSVAVAALDCYCVPSVGLNAVDDSNFLLLRLKTRTLFDMQFKMGLQGISV